MRAVLVTIAVLAALAGCSSAVSGHAAGPRQELSCPTGAVTAQGAPFCYPLPAGFHDDTAQAKPDGSWTYYTLVSVGQHDLIQAAAASIGVDTDTKNDAELATLADQQLLHPGQFKVVTASARTTLPVDRARAFAQDAKYQSGVGARQVVVYRGRTLVQISCQYLDKQAVVQKACTDVLDNIQVVGLPH